MAKKYTCISFYATPDLVEALARQKDETGVPTTTYLRQLVRAALFVDSHPVKVETRRAAPVLLGSQR
jgi:hypothetical protein